MENCMFCGITDSGNAVYEDSKCVIVPDKYPSQYGHMLVISKEHHQDVLSSPEELAAHMFIIAKRFGGKLKERLKAQGLAISTNAGKEAGQIIFHFHIHVIPFGAEGAGKFARHKEITEDEIKTFKKLLG